MNNLDRFHTFIRLLLIKHNLHDDINYSLQELANIHSFQLHIYSIDHFQILKRLSPTTKTFWEDIDFFGNAELSVTFTKESVILHSSFDYYPQSEQDEILYIKRYNYPCRSLTKIQEIEHRNRVKLLVRPNEELPYFQYLTLEDIQQIEKDIHQLILLQLEHIKADYLLYLKNIHQEMVDVLHE